MIIQSLPAQVSIQVGPQVIDVRAVQIITNAQIQVKVQG